MKRFLIVEEQNGGCDYTIGCGTRTTQEEAESIDALMATLKARALEDGADGVGSEFLYEDRVAFVTVYEIAEERNVPLEAWQEESRAAASAAVRDSERRERETLAALQAKYGAAK